MRKPNEHLKIKIGPVEVTAGGTLSVVLAVAFLLIYFKVPALSW